MRAANWDAIGVSSKFTTSARTYLAARYEFYGDHDGFATGYGSQLNLQEFTFTYAYKWVHGVEMRTEWRHDWSDQPFFEFHNQGQPLNPGIGTFLPGPKKHQDTITIGFIAFFGGK
ncbi:MAG: outer membrane beta-barrel protein [Acidobacteriota bacterium]